MWIESHRDAVVEWIERGTCKAERSDGLCGSCSGSTGLWSRPLTYIHSQSRRSVSSAAVETTPYLSSWNARRKVAQPNRTNRQHCDRSSSITGQVPCGPMKKTRKNHNEVAQESISKCTCNTTQLKHPKNEWNLRKALQSSASHWYLYNKINSIKISEKQNHQIVEIAMKSREKPNQTRSHHDCPSFWELSKVIFVISLHIVNSLVVSFFTTLSKEGRTMFLRINTNARSRYGGTIHFVLKSKTNI